MSPTVMEEKNPAPSTPLRRILAHDPHDASPSWKATLLPVGLLLFIFWASNAAMETVERFNYIKSYPSRFTISNLPNDALELATFMSDKVAPAPVKLAFKAAQHYLYPDPRTLPVDVFIKLEEPIAWARLMDNINPEGTAEGCVVASPNRVAPNYWYSWTRDSALVMRTIVGRFRAGETKYRPTIDSYISGTRSIQQQETLIGGFSSGGLGEVKYEVNNSAFMGEWGRPQNDGPALRVITLSEFAHHQLDHGIEADKEFVKAVLYDGKTPTTSVIKGDLEHIAHRWADPGFDLWEEVSGSHFYTSLAIYSGLMTGAKLAERLDDPKAAEFYRAEAATIAKVLEKFWSEEKGIVRVTLNHTKGRESEENAHEGDNLYGKTSELDAAIVLAVLHSGEGTEWEANPKIFATLHKLIETMLPLYPINKAPAPGIGRYPEDRYDGVGLSEGHPWYLCTLSAAELLYRSSSRLSSSTVSLDIPPYARAWYSRFIPLGASDKNSVVKPDSIGMGKIVEGQRKLADQFVGVVQEFARRNGSLNEQFHRTTGEGRGARDLTWSYAAFITASQARRGE